MSEPLSAPVKFDTLDYFRLRLLISEAELVVMKAQAQVNAAVGARDAYLRELTTRYSFDATTITHMQWNDETMEFSFS